MLSRIASFFFPSPADELAHRLYGQVVAQARRSYFYEALRVPDTLDGRFDMIVLHLVLLDEKLRRLEAGMPAELRSRIGEVFISDMDRSLREMGVGDTGVGKRIKRMGEALLGRRQSYVHCLQQQDQALLAKHLLKNVYRDEQDCRDEAEDLAVYSLKAHSHLLSLPAGEVTKGNISFLAPESTLLEMS